MKTINTPIRPQMGLPFGLSLLFFISAIVSLSTPSAHAMDAVNGQKRMKTVDFELLTREQLCVLCQAVLNRWKEQANRNEQHFREELLTSCSLMENPAEVKKCREGVTDGKVTRLRKEGSEDICVAEGFCGKGELRELEKKMERLEKRIDARKQKFEKGLRTIPPVILSPEKTARGDNKTDTNQSRGGG